MILGYLQDEGFGLTKTVLQDEANVKAAGARERSGDFKAFRKAVRGALSRHDQWTNMHRW